MNIRRYSEPDLSGILALCSQEGWPSLVENPLRANRVLTAPGVTTVVAEEDGIVVGFAQIQSDGEIQAHLSLIAVTAAARGFTQKTRTGEDRHALRNAAQAVVGEQRRTKQALVNLYPALAA